MVGWYGKRGRCCHMAKREKNVSIDGRKAEGTLSGDCFGVLFIVYVAPKRIDNRF